MHTHTVQTKFTFGDRVRVDSTLQQFSGTGTVFAICFDGDGIIDYLITVDGEDLLRGGIQEYEMTLLTDSADPPQTVG
jgi:hypothetical protein